MSPAACFDPGVTVVALFVAFGLGICLGFAFGWLAVRTAVPDPESDPIFGSKKP